MNLSLSRKEKIALLLIFIYLFLFFKPVIAGDGWGYYAILEAWIRDGTLDMANQTRFNNINPGLSFVNYYNSTGRWSVGKPFGLSLLSIPLYSLSLVLDDFEIFHIKDGFFLKERKDILIHMMGMTVTSLIFAVVALVVSLFLVKRFYPQHGASSLLLAFFSSSLLIYATYDLSYTHAAEAGLMAILVWTILKDKPLYSGVLIGLMTTIRYTSLLFLLPLVIFYLWKRQKKQSLLSIAGAVPFVLAILAYWFISFGAFFPGHSAYYEYSLEAIPRTAVSMLFDLNRGLVFWTPGIILAVIGLLFWREEKKWIFLSCIILTLLLYSAYSQPFGGSGFGIRWYTVFFPLFAIGFAAFQNRWKKARYGLFILAGYTLVISLLYLGIPAEDFTHLIQLWSAEGIQSFPQLLSEKISFVRFVLEM